VSWPKGEAMPHRCGRSGAFTIRSNLPAPARIARRPSGAGREHGAHRAGGRFPEIDNFLPPGRGGSG
jgi:hypothetical protein